MKRRIALVGMAILGGMPQAVGAKDIAAAGAYAAASSTFAPRYRVDAPLMDHFDPPALQPAGTGAEAWRLQLAPPPPPSAAADDPLAATDKRFGFSLQRAF
jgi:hypothetical protein